MHSITPYLVPRVFGLILVDRTRIWRISSWNVIDALTFLSVHGRSLHLGPLSFLAMSPEWTSPVAIAAYTVLARPETSSVIVACVALAAIGLKFHCRLWLCRIVSMAFTFALIRQPVYVRLTWSILAAVYPTFGVETLEMDEAKLESVWPTCGREGIVSGRWTQAHRLHVFWQRRASKLAERDDCAGDDMSPRVGDVLQLLSVIYGVCRERITGKEAMKLEKKTRKVYGPLVLFSDMEDGLAGVDGEEPIATASDDMASVRLVGDNRQRQFRVQYRVHRRERYANKQNMFMAALQEHFELMAMAGQVLGDGELCSICVEPIRGILCTDGAARFHHWGCGDMALKQPWTWKTVVPNVEGRGEAEVLSPTRDSGGRRCKMKARRSLAERVRQRTRGTVSSDTSFVNSKRGWMQTVKCRGPCDESCLLVASECGKPHWASRWPLNGARLGQCCVRDESIGGGRKVSNN